MKKLFIFLLFPIATYGQSRFIRVLNTIEDMVAASNNPNQIHTNIWVNDTNRGGLFITRIGPSVTNTTDVFRSMNNTNYYFERFKLLTTDVGITNISNLSSNNPNILSGNYFPGSNVTFVTNSFGAVTISSTGGGGGGGTNFGWQSIGSGADFPLTNGFEHVIFGGVTSSDILLTNAGTYQIVLTVGAFANNSFAQHYYLTNITDNLPIPGSEHDISVNSVEAPLVIAVQYTTTGSNKAIELWGSTDDAAYTGAPNVLSERTVADILVVATTAFGTFSTGVGVTNISNVVSGNYSPGANITFTTNSFGNVTITGSASGSLQVFSGFYGGGLPTDVPTTSAALAYDLDPPNTMYQWDGTIWY